MEEKKNVMQNLQKRSREALLKILNNVGIIGSVLAACADLIFVIIMVVGVDIKANLTSIIIFAVVNAVIGILINNLMRYQGKKYAELENEELCKRFYKKRVREKKYIPIGAWMALKSIQDVVIKGCTTAFSIFGVIYITIQGSKNPIQILITIVTLIMFACFGFMGMNSSYCRFYNVQVPYMQLKLNLRENEEDNIEGDKNETNEPDAASNPNNDDNYNECRDPDSDRNDAIIQGVEDIEEKEDSIGDKHD